MTSVVIASQGGPGGGSGHAATRGAAPAMLRERGAEQTDTLRASIADALLSGGNPMGVAYRHNVPIGYVATIAAALKIAAAKAQPKPSGKPKPKKRRLIKAAGC